MFKSSIKKKNNLSLFRSQRSWAPCSLNSSFYQSIVESNVTAQTDSCYKTMTHRETSKSRYYTGPFKLQSSSDWNVCKTLREQCKEEWARFLPPLCKTPIKSHRFTWFTIKLLLLKVFLQVTESWSGVFLTLLQHYSLFFVK